MIFQRCFKFCYLVIMLACVSIVLSQTTQITTTDPKKEEQLSKMADIINKGDKVLIEKGLKKKAIAHCAYLARSCARMMARTCKLWSECSEALEKAGVKAEANQFFDQVVLEFMKGFNQHFSEPSTKLSAPTTVKLNSGNRNNAMNRNQNANRNYNRNQNQNNYGNRNYNQDNLGNRMNYNQDGNRNQNRNYNVDGNRMNYNQNRNQNVDGNRMNYNVDGNRAVDGNRMNYNVDGNRAVDGNRMNYNVDGNRMNYNVDGNRAVDGNRINYNVDGNRAVDGNRMNYNVDGNRAVDGNRINYNVDGNRAVDGNRMNYNVDGNRAVDGNRMNYNVDGNRAVDGNRMNYNVDGNRMNYNVDGNRINPNVDGNKINPNVDGNRANQNVDGNQNQNRNFNRNNNRNFNNRNFNNRNYNNRNFNRNTFDNRASFSRPYGQEEINPDHLPEDVVYSDELDDNAQQQSTDPLTPRSPSTVEVSITPATVQTQRTKSSYREVKRYDFYNQPQPAHNPRSFRKQDTSVRISNPRFNQRFAEKQDETTPTSKATSATSTTSSTSTTTTPRPETSKQTDGFSSSKYRGYTSYDFTQKSESPKTTTKLPTPSTSQLAQISGLMKNLGFGSDQSFSGTVKPKEPQEESKKKVEGSDDSTGGHSYSGVYKPNYSF